MKWADLFPAYQTSIKKSSDGLESINKILHSDVKIILYIVRESNLPPFLQLAAVRRKLFSSLFPAESQEQKLECTKPTAKQELDH